jgi:hypothetical protein
MKEVSATTTSGLSIIFSYIIIIKETELDSCGIMWIQDVFGLAVDF